MHETALRSLIEQWEANGANEALTEDARRSYRCRARELSAALAAVPPQDGQAWYARAVKARNALMDAVKQLRGGHSAHMDACDLAFAELDIVLGLAPYRTGAALAAVETPQAPPSLSIAQKLNVLIAETRRCIEDDKLMAAYRKMDAMSALIVRGDEPNPLSGREYCPRCSSGPRQPVDLVECPDCGYAWSGPPLVAPATPLSQEREK